MENIVNITPENFEQIILETSKEKLVLVDFWAEWCEPCKAITPVLEKLAAKYKNDLVLAKVDCDAQQSISMQFGVRSLPTVILVKDSQPVDGFAGLKTEQEIQTWLDQHLPNPEDTLLQQASELYAQHNFADALPLVKQAHDMCPQRSDVKVLLADLHIELGHLELAKSLVQNVGLADQDGHYHSVISKIELAEQAADTPEIQALQQALSQNPDSLELKVSLAVQLQQAHRNEEALSLLFEVLKKDFGFGDAKKLMLDTLNALPDGDPLASQFRRKMYSLMY